MFKVIVVDDEKLVRQGIVMETDWKELDCVVVAEADNGLDGLYARMCVMDTYASV